MNIRRLSRWLATLACALLASAAAAEGAAPPPGCTVGIEREEVVAFPEGDLFCPLVADPRAMRSFLSYERGDFPDSTGARGIGSVGIADGVGLVRWGGRRPGEGLQIGLEAGVFAQFDLGASSADLLNADYVVGLPLTLRSGNVSGRLRLYHQSSHLGDELLDRVEIRNEGLSYEAVEALVSAELGAVRVYGGGEYVFGRRPLTLDPYVAHAGVELRVPAARGTQLVGALDVKSGEQRDWEPAWAIHAGVELAYASRPDRPPRIIGAFAEFYDGPSPYGQFFLDRSRFFGFGLHLQR
jgi:hypothetical protein